MNSNTYSINYSNVDNIAKDPKYYIQFNEISKTNEIKFDSYNTQSYFWNCQGEFCENIDFIMQHILSIGCRSITKNKNLNKHEKVILANLSLKIDYNSRGIYTNIPTISIDEML